ncbi:Uncharacterized protein LOCC1_G001283 [Lachnellula occidentalis]|uniref:PhoD-like phosphatase domain-containing protein n=1 Tax=Lachnellula occidentalis TaxID=215460 RepID=A0A8H8UHD1_9HELO|nr:Uncharacterized protein LOCC1_G001283 [Lachnellula occidentalis]
MASHYRDNILHGRDHPDDHASDTRWRHQESEAFRRHAGKAAVGPREADARHGSKDLANFFNSTRVDPPGSAGSRSEKHQPIMVAGNSRNGPSTGQSMATQHDGTQGGDNTAGSGNALEVKCGPLLNYRRMENETWYGSVLIVTRGGGSGESLINPHLTLKIVGNVHPAEASSTAGPSLGASTNGAEKENYGVVDGIDYGNFQDPTPPQTKSNGTNGNTAAIEVGKGSWEVKVPGTRLYSDPANTFWRFSLEVPMQQAEIQCEYTISGAEFTQAKRGARQHFYVPAITESMRIMFHSCNGFSVGTDEAAYSGACLWNDVIRVHEKTPFHVMVGGGDQIYILDDGIRVNGPLRAWTDIANPKKRREYPFPESLRKDCDDYYANNYIHWYGTEPFASANGQIAQLNIWDDHDIIDGFGSYTDEFMRCAVFRGIGGVANKYYLLFQHHLAPPASTFTTGRLSSDIPTHSPEPLEDAPQTTAEDRARLDTRQLENTFVLDEPIDSSYIIGDRPGPYVTEHSRSIYARLGARVAFFGLDARTERTRHQVNYPETYEIIAKRLRDELGAAKASSSPIQHLVVLLGIPIAYPRLTWLENIFSSPVIAPIKFLNKRFGFGGGFFNHFDGSVDLLDDLDDHYTARTHKKERLMLVHQLQELASEFSVRVTILGGDVHLAAVGRFYSNPQLNVPIDQDHRYMVNIVSSAIVNKPPPQAVANLLARRNKLHHLDHNTDETLMKFFDKDPGTVSKTSNSNKVTMPSRNWAMLTENHHGTHIPNGHTTNGHANEGAETANPSVETIPRAKDGHSWLHKGEENAGTTHRAANSERHGRDNDGSLDVSIRVEVDQHDPEGKTQPYGMTIPTLVYAGAAEQTLRKRDRLPGSSHGRASTASRGVSRGASRGEA